MTALLAWLDQSDDEQRKMREAIGLFRDEGAVDELGMGRIRDAFSDGLFPGTSVLWRRARYLFFVPWIYLLLERGEGGSGSAEERARLLQRRLARVLIESEGLAKGVIGASGANVKQPPDTILWAALAAWGTRIDPGGLRQVRAAAMARSASRTALEEEPEADATWHPRVVRLLPEEFPATASFALRPAEARLLFELMQSADALPGTVASRRADSLLAVLLREPPSDGLDVPWGHKMKTASPRLREAVSHAGCFSDAIQGARLLYAHLVAIVQKDDALAAAVDREFHGWLSFLENGRLAELTAWRAELPAFWKVVKDVNPRVGDREGAFVREWAALALDDPEGLRNSAEAQSLIVRREHQAKGRTKARLGLEGLVGRDAPAVVPGRLTFRWEQAKSIASDIAAAL